MLTAWVPLRGSREQAGPTTVQMDANRRDPPTKIDRVFVLVRPWFRQRSADLANRQQVPSIALSRRQRGFESRWGYKIKVVLQGSNASASCRRCQGQHELRERQGSRGRPPLNRSRLSCRLTFLGVEGSVVGVERHYRSSALHLPD